MKFKNLNNFITKIPANYLADMAKKNVAFVGNCKDLYTYFQKINKNCKYFFITKQNWKSVVKSLTQKDKNNMPKFDVIVGNPPYEGNGNPLYLQILEKVNVNNNRVIWLCPSQWVKNYKDSKYLTNVKNVTCSNLVFHEFIGNPFEDASTANEVGIFVFGEGVKENYETIRMERFLNASLAKSIWEKFEKVSNIGKYTRVDFNKKYYVYASEVRGHYFGGKNFCWDWTTLFGEEQRENFYTVKPNGHWHFWNFDTINECKNFVASIETDILMFAHYIGKVHNKNNEITISLISWLGDYTKQWTEKEIAEKLKLTQEEVDYIHQEMKNFGWKVSPKAFKPVRNVTTISEKVNITNVKPGIVNKVKTNNTLTNKQTENYNKLYGAMWRIIDKTIPTNKEQRSVGFAHARKESMRLVLNNNAKNYNNIYGSMWRMIDKTISKENKTQRSFGFGLARKEAAKIAK